MARPQRKLLKQQQKLKKSLLKQNFDVKSAAIVNEVDQEMIPVDEMDDSPQMIGRVPDQIPINPRTNHQNPKKNPLSSLVSQVATGGIKKMTKRDKSTKKRQDLLQRLTTQSNQRADAEQEEQRKRKQRGFDMRSLLLSASAAVLGADTPSTEAQSNQKPLTVNAITTAVEDSPNEVSQQEPSAAPKGKRVTSRRGRDQTLRKEQQQLQRVLMHPIYQQRPIGTIREHLLNSLNAQP